MTHIMIVSANGSEAKALFYLLQRAGLGAVDLSICPGEHLVRLVAERGAGVILAEAEALGDKPEQVLDELFRVAPECQVVLYSGNTVQMDALRTLKRDNVQMLMRPLRKTQIQRAVARALEQAGHGPRQAQCEQLLRIMTQRTLDDLLEGRTEEACKSLNALGLEQECGAVYLAWLSEPLALRESENLAAELRGRLLGVGCTALLRVSGGSLAAVGFAPADQQAAVMGTLETALKRYCFEHERKHQLSSAPFDSLEELPEALQQAAAGLGPRVGWAEPLLKPERPVMPVRVERVRQYIQEHFCEEISLESIAAVCGMSKYYLCHVFKENMGVSVFNYLIWLRMEEARRLLATTTLKVSQVGSRVGYADPNYFITAFKKQEGVTPTEYRAGQTVRRLNAE